MTTLQSGTRGPSLCFLGVFLIASFGLALADATHFDAAGFGALSQKDRVDFLLAALASRESRMSNYWIEFSRDKFNLNTKTGEREQRLRADYALKKKGERYLFEGRNYSPKEPQNPRSIFSSLWNGEYQKALTITHNGQDVQGDIWPDEFDLVYRLGLLHALGFQAPYAFKDVGKETVPFIGSTVAWLKKCRDGHVPMSVTVDAFLGDATIVLRLDQGFMGPVTYYFSPARDYMLIRYSQRSGDAVHFNSCETNVVDMRQTQGEMTWVPWVVVVVNDTSAKLSLGSQYADVVFVERYEVAMLRQDSVTDSDLSLGYPAGTLVVDHLLKTAYRVGEHGEVVENWPYYDANTGQTFSAGQQMQSVVAAAQIAPATKLSVAPPTGGPDGVSVADASAGLSGEGPTAVAVPPSRPWKAYLGVAIIGVCVLAVVVYTVRRPRRVV